MTTELTLYRWALPLLAIGAILIEARGFCSLEDMKHHAMQACEHLFQMDEGREKRSIDYNHRHHSNHLGYGKHDKHHFSISRSNYPTGGYLKVSIEHYRRLSELDVLPRYKAKKHHQKVERYKRDHLSTHNNNIVYCCINNCKDDFFC